MSGVAWAAAAGLLFGVFQAVNRRANDLIDAYRGTFALIMVSAVAVGVVAVTTQDLSLLSRAPAVSILSFLAAGVVHFFVGWTLLSLSQQRAGAAGTGVVLAATPLIATVLGALVLRERLPSLTAAGVVLTVIGLALISLRQVGTGVGFRAVPWFGLGSAVCWGISPLLIRFGLEGLPSPLLGVTIGLSGAAVLYGVFLAFGGGPSTRAGPGVAPWLLLAGLLVAAAITSQWTAFKLVEISVAVTLIQLATPTVVILAPLIVRSESERATPALIGGMAAVLAGSLLVIWAVQI